MEQNIKEYVITNGEKYIRRNLDNKYVQTSNISLADIFNKKKEAENIKLNSLSRSLSRLYYVAEIVDGKIIRCDSPRPDTIIRQKGSNTYCYPKEFYNTKWHNGFGNLMELFNEAEEKLNSLCQEISDIEAQIIDLEHYIEFNSVNARDGYILYRKLKSLLQKRRYLKDEQKVVSAINKNRSATVQIKSILNSLDYGSGVEYRPRILCDLFENGISSLKGGAENEHI